MHVNSLSSEVAAMSACRPESTHARPCRLSEVAKRRVELSQKRRKGDDNRYWVRRLGCPALLRLVRLFQAQALVDDLRYIGFVHFHVPQPFRPDHHIGTDAYHAYFALEILFFDDFSQFFVDFFRAVLATGFALAVTVVDADVELANVRLPLRDREPPLGRYVQTYSRKKNPLHAADFT